MPKTQKSKKVKGWYRPIISRVLGTILLLGVIALAAPLAVPRIMGYGVYEVISGSMEPEIPMGSVIYVQPCEPMSVEQDEVIAFMRDEAVVAHRVVYNRTTFSEFITKGDANNVEDPDPVPYDAFVGRVKTSIPLLGQFMSVYASTAGKIYLFLTATCGALLHVLADQQHRALSKKMKEQINQ